MPEAITLTIQSDGIATIVLDLPGKPVNTMTRQVWSELDAAIGAVSIGEAKGLIIASRKPRTFLAGADLNEISAMGDDELRNYLQEGQRIYQRLSDLAIPTVAAINGDALGGGLELALACKMRVAVDDAALQLGLPETKIGLIPGWGGTVRFPRRVGLAIALPLVLSGKAINGLEAEKIGLVDRVVPREKLIETARQMVLHPVTQATQADVSREEANRLLDSARDAQLKRFQDHYPAPLRLIEVIRDSYLKGLPAGFAGEIQGLIDLKNGEAGKNLLRVFFMRSTAKKDAAKKAGGVPRDVNSAVVFGGGTMGSGIAHALVKSGIATTIVEANEDLACAARNRVQKVIDDDTRAGRMASEAAGKASGLLSVALKPECSANADLVIEAIVEQLPAKIALFKQLDGIIGRDAILATNTSSLSVTEIAAATSNPSRVVGLHFFNPVPRMPLVEVVRTKQSDANAVATAVALAGKLGKSPVLCNDAPGFVVNRVLFPQLHEACRLCEEGFDITAIDSAIKRWGMPMGPFELMDEIGLDVTLFILQSFQKSLGEKFAPSVALRELVHLGCSGKKTGKGFYIHSKEKGVPPVVNKEAMMIFKNTHRAISSPEEIQHRIMNPMAEEAKSLLSEGVVEDAEAIDVATILGLGFANFRGGLATWMKNSCK